MRDKSITSKLNTLRGLACCCCCCDTPSPCAPFLPKSDLPAPFLNGSSTMRPGCCFREGGGDPCIDSAYTYLSGPDSWAKAQGNPIHRGDEGTRVHPYLISQACAKPGTLCTIVRIIVIFALLLVIVLYVPSTPSLVFVVITARVSTPIGSQPVGQLCINPLYYCCQLIYSI